MRASPRPSWTYCTADGRPVTGPQGPQWKGRNKPHRADRAWTTGWSPEQISRRLRAEFPEDESMRISHEAIYRRFMSRAVAPSSANSSPACGPVGRSVLPEPAKQRGWAHVTSDTLISERPA